MPVLDQVYFFKTKFSCTEILHSSTALMCFLFSLSLKKKSHYKQHVPTFLRVLFTSVNHHTLLAYPVPQMDQHHKIHTHLNNTDQHRPDVQTHCASSNVHRFFLSEVSLQHFNKQFVHGYLALAVNTCPVPSDNLVCLT